LGVARPNIDLFDLFNSNIGKDYLQCKYMLRPPIRNAAKALTKVIKIMFIKITALGKSYLR